MKKANPADGVWFVLAHLGDGPFLPTDVPQDYYLVCATVLNGDWPVALWFDETTRTLPNDMGTRNRADRWAQECLEWWSKGMMSGEPFDKWPEDPPHDFLFADSSLPGSLFHFAKDKHSHRGAIQKVVPHFALMLRNVWPTWTTWGETKGIPEHPAMKNATFYEE